MIDLASIDGNLEQLENEWQNALDASQRLRELGVSLNFDIIDRGDYSNELTKEVRIWEQRISQTEQKLKSQVTEWESFGLNIQEFLEIEYRELEREVREKNICWFSSKRTSRFTGFS